MNINYGDKNKNTSGKYTFKLVYMSTNSITSGTAIYLLCQKSLASNINWGTACSYIWSANIKDTNGNLYELKDIKIPTRDQLRIITSDNLRAVGVNYWTSTEVNSDHAWEMYNDGDNFEYNGWDSGHLKYMAKNVVPFISLTLK